jgi:sulfite reductase (ferredoxin)
MSNSTQPPTSPAPIKETKAQKSERLKREKNPWQAFDEVRAFAREGRGSVLPEWANFYFKWWGIYTQGDGAGVTGGTGGEGVTTEYLLMRIGVPNGLLSSHQARTIGRIARIHAKDLVDITVRQAIQLHWLKIEDLPEIVDTLDKAGLSPKGACGDVVRNVTGCPMAGIHAHELVDASALALAISKELSGNSDFYNLPRKFKISVSGCPDWCSYPEINDVGLTAVNRGDEIGYSIRIGGGLSKEPHLSLKLDCFLLEQEVIPVVRATAEIFREQQGLRESRDRARLKYLFLREGWTAESFLAAVESKLGYKLAAGVVDIYPDEILRDHTGVQPQKQADKFTLGASVLRGRITGTILERVAELAGLYAAGQIRTTVQQNLLIPNVAREHVQTVIAALAELGLRVEGSNFWRGTIACTGTEFCKLAITETKGFARWLVDEMEARLPEFDQQLQLHITGCPNSCGQHWIADIGLEGKKIKIDGKLADAWAFALGGAVGKDASLARQTNYRCSSAEVPDAIERLLRTYLSTRSAGESLQRWIAGKENTELQTVLTAV